MLRRPYALFVIELKGCIVQILGVTLNTLTPG